MEKKTKVVSIRLSEDELEALEELSKMAHWSLSKTCSNILHVGLIIASSLEDTPVDDAIKATVEEAVKNAI